MGSDWADTRSDFMSDQMEAQAKLQWWNTMFNGGRQRRNAWMMHDSDAMDTYGDMMGDRYDTMMDHNEMMGRVGNMRFPYIDRKRRQAQCDLFYMTYPNGATSDFYPICNEAMILPTLQEAQNVCLE